MTELVEKIGEELLKEPEKVSFVLQTTLHLASSEQHLQALAMACSYGHIALFEFLFAPPFNLSPDTVLGSSAESLLMIACRGPKPNATSAKYLLKKGSSVHSVDFIKDTALHQICWSPKNEINEQEKQKRLAIARLLLEKGADPNVQNQSGETPLYYVCTSGDWVEMLDLLIEFGGDIHQITDAGTALSLAYVYNHAKIFQALLDKGADPDAKESGTETGWLDASLAGGLEVQTILSTYLSKKALAQTLPSASQLKPTNRL